MDKSYDYRILTVLENVEADPSETIPNLARLVNLSNSRLGHLFKDETGITLNSFLENQRMKKAAELLRSTEMRVNQISCLMGYRHEPSFNRAFQKAFQCSPTSYRKRLRMEERNARALVEIPSSSDSMQDGLDRADVA